ncbi:hypothetical protein WS69_29165 [Burkholderia sp. BDU5]|nr:hypothetical protein WS69_29165 [Burkholderia sp. BDU5]
MIRRRARHPTRTGRRRSRACRVPASSIERAPIDRGPASADARLTVSPTAQAAAFSSRPLIAFEFRKTMTTATGDSSEALGLKFRIHPIQAGTSRNSIISIH